MNYGGHKALRRNMAGLANNLCDLKTTLKVLEETYHYRHDELPERLAGISLRRISVLMDEAFSIALLLDESFRD
ncbi:hypothetical protein AB4W76_30595 (plasmid) [Klebsiella pasteurii]|uniref:hypothetical protein n=1 Tax=Klebsiella pasteurii TaxID=2587529 RepID=UPI0029365183|nr:hypothetical protein [Raoultella ornithinolytica]